jgi:8-oxo-dGTP pyrophosphatase MutT (NUDIX family)
MYRKKTICMNCSKEGHIFKRCPLPTMSYGIIGVRNGEFLLIQRKDSIGFSDFMRGKYVTKEVLNKWKLKCLLEEMTNDELERVKMQRFEQLWYELWMDRDSSIFRNEKLKAQALFEDKYIKNIVASSGVTRYNETEWGFPKGRKNLMESDISCAKREFQEETGLKNTDYKIISETATITETFTASDGVTYIHIYYIAIINDDVILSNIQKTDIFDQEVKDIRFFSYKQAYKKLRDYDTQKRMVLTSVHNFFLSRLYNE